MIRPLHMNDAHHRTFAICELDVGSSCTGEAIYIGSMHMDHINSTLPLAFTYIIDVHDTSGIRSRRTCME
jgi:hypothetical protein